MQPALIAVMLLGNGLNGGLWELQQAVRIACEIENKVELLTLGGWAKDLGHGQSAGTGNSRVIG